MMPAQPDLWRSRHERWERPGTAFTLSAVKRPLPFLSGPTPLMRKAPRSRRFVHGGAIVQGGTVRLLVACLGNPRIIGRGSAVSITRLVSPGQAFETWAATR